MLREKDLEMAEYENLACQVSEICKVHQVKLIINQNIEVVKKIKIENIQISWKN